MKVGIVLPRMTISVKVGKVKSLATISIKTFVKVSIQKSYHDKHESRYRPATDDNLCESRQLKVLPRKVLNFSESKHSKSYHDKHESRYSPATDNNIRESRQN
jgi:hypothetical protein